MQHFIVKPSPVGDLTFANTNYQSLYGNIEVNWKKEEKSASFHIEVPVNTAAKIYIPAKDSKDVLEGETIAENVKGITYLGTEKSDAVGNYIIYKVGSGVYNFKVNTLPKVNYPDPINKPDNLALIGRMNASSMTIQSEKLPVFEALRANDKDLKTHWKASSISNNEWLEIEWFKPETFNKIVLHEEGTNISNYKLQYFDEEEWKTIASGTSCGANKVHDFKTITTSKCRLLILKTKRKPMISEFKILYVK